MIQLHFVNVYESTTWTQVHPQQHTLLMEEQTSFDIDDLFKGVEEDVQTSFGPISVTVYGDRSKTPCVALHDVGLNHRTCFQSLLVASGPQSLMARNFYMLFIDAPGCEVRMIRGCFIVGGACIEDTAD